MSQKSKRKRNVEAISPENLLPRQKAGIKESAYDFLGVTILFAVMATVAWLVGLSIEDSAHSNRVIFGVTPILLGFAILFFGFFLQRISVFRKLHGVDPGSEQTLRIDCSQVRLRTHPISRSEFLILYIVFVDENKQKYYYVYPKDGCPGGSAAKSLRDSLQGGVVDLVCYRNTSVVKSFQKSAE